MTPAGATTRTTATPAKSRSAPNAAECATTAKGISATNAVARVMAATTAWSNARPVMTAFARSASAMEFATTAENPTSLPQRERRPRWRPRRRGRILCFCVNEGRWKLAASGLPRRQELDCRADKGLLGGWGWERCRPSGLLSGERLERCPRVGWSWQAGGDERTGESAASKRRKSQQTPRRLPCWSQTD